MTNKCVGLKAEVSLAVTHVIESRQTGLESKNHRSNKSQKGAHTCYPKASEERHFSTSEAPQRSKGKQAWAESTAFHRGLQRASVHSSY